MGNRESILEDIQIYKPPIEDFIFKDPGVQFKIYQHRYNNYEVMAHKITLNQERQLPILIENFKARYQHHYLVSTLFIDCEDYSTCGGYFQSVIFYQRIFTNLSKIKDIPFPDVLHFYAVALKGFQILFQRFGYFEVYEDMFHLGQDSKLKVWCNKDIIKNEPEAYLIDRTGTQQDMVRKIIFIIDQNTDHLTDKMKIKDKLLAYGVRNFQMSHISLRQVCRQYNLSVPQRVQCMTSLTSNQVQSMLDLYSSGNKINQASILPKIVQNLNTPYPARSNVEEINTKNTPYFNPPQISHTPITQQFVIPSGTHHASTYHPNLHHPNMHHANTQYQNFHPSNLHHPNMHHPNMHPSNIPELNLSKISNRNNEQSMIHTFNERPQIPNFHNRHGINLSLANGKHRKVSNRQNPLHAQTRDRSLPSRSNHQVIQGKDVRYASLERKPQIKINFVNQNKLITPALTNYQTLQQRFSKPQTIYHQNQHINGRFPVQIRREYQKQPHQFIDIPESLSRINILPTNEQRYHSHDQVNRNGQSRVAYNPALNILSRPTQILKRSNHSVNMSNLSNSRNITANYVIQSNLSKRIPNSNQYAQTHKKQPLVETQFYQAPQSSKQYDSSNYQTRERRNSNKYTHKYQQTKPQFLKTKKQLHHPSDIEQQALKKNVSTPVLNNGQNYLFQKTRQSPFRIIEQKNDIKKPELRSAYENLNLQVPIDRNTGSQFNNVHSASSRYLYSNRQLNDNIPDLKYKKSSPKKNIGQLFDTKIQELQSFNESKFGTQNSLKDFQDRNSQVLQIIGRSKKDSVTSAFDNQQLTKRPDQIKQFTVSQNSYNYLKQENAHHNKDKNKDSFTDPKILQILRKPSSKALQYQINNLKKVSKSTKSYEFSNELSAKRPTVKKQIKEDFMKLDRNWETQKPYNFEEKNGKQNFTQFQGFPSLSNLSEINHAEQLSFNEDKVNTTLNNAKAMIKKSRFSEQKIVMKESQNAVSEFYQYDYQSPKYEYSFAGKRQIPMQDNEWKAKYGTIFNSGKDQSISTLQKTNYFKASPLKPFNFLTNFNSNESLASLQFEMSKRNTNMLKNGKDQVIQSFGEYSQQMKSTNQHHQINTISSNRKYNPKLDPQISKDLQRFRRQKFEFSKK